MGTGTIVNDGREVSSLAESRIEFSARIPQYRFSGNKGKSN
jgi:hypothetical protein